MSFSAQVLVISLSAYLINNISMLLCSRFPDNLLYAEIFKSFQTCNLVFVNLLVSGIMCTLEIKILFVFQFTSSFVEAV